MKDLIFILIIIGIGSFLLSVLMHLIVTYYRSETPVASHIKIRNCLPFSYLTHPLPVSGSPPLNLAINCISIILVSVYLYPNLLPSVTLYHHWFIFMIGLCLLFITDISSFLLPLPINGFLILLGLGVSLYHDPLYLLNQLIITSLIVGTLYLIRLISNAIYKKDTLGLGDIILIFAICINWGWEIGLSACYLGIILGGCISLALLVFKRVNKSQYIAFGPFIIIGYLLSFFGVPITQFLL